MPGVLKKEETGKIAGAISYPVQENQVDRENMAAQQRPPTNLQGLLRLVMETNRNENAAGPSAAEPMDEERRKFLEDALKAMTIDVVELLLKQISVFDNVRTISADDDVTEYNAAFEAILDYIDNMDIANDFHKIGGFKIFNPCMGCVHPIIRAGACELLAELCQNNPYCQRVATENGFVPLLISILDQDVDEVCVKVVYALSSIVRDNRDGLRLFLRHNGLDVMLKAIKGGDNKLQTKAAFFMCGVCQMCDNLKDRLITQGYLQVLMPILNDERTPSHEHVLLLLNLLIDGNETAAQVCREPQHNLLSALKSITEVTEGKDECNEENQYCRNLLDFLFPGWCN